MNSVYEAQAKYYANIPLLQRDYIASVHLEDKEDERFCNAVLQRARKGRYYFVSHSKNNKGTETTGCEQCLKFKPWLSTRFFIFIDSDLRYIMQENGIDAQHYICQTYTYSWENHYCKASHLQNRYETACSKIQEPVTFDFVLFLTELSEALFLPFVLFYHNKRKGTEDFTAKDLFGCLPSQCHRSDIVDNGKLLLDDIKNRLSKYTEKALSIDLNNDIECLNNLGINKDNVYLHVRGHNLFDMISYIGRLLAKGTQMSFYKDVLISDIPSGYWQITKIESDANSILG